MVGDFTSNGDRNGRLTLVLLSGRSKVDLIWLILSSELPWAGSVQAGQEWGRRVIKQIGRLGYKCRDNKKDELVEGDKRFA